VAAVSKDSIFASRAGVFAVFFAVFFAVLAPWACGGGQAHSDAATSSDAAGSGGSDAGGAGPDAATTGPIVAPAGTWTWIPFPDAFCADGSTTGIGVNLGAADARALIYLEGGGACWSEDTCYTQMTATNFTTGYSAANFAIDAANASELAEPGGFFDRQSAANPFKNYSYVYVPYCTGDVHAGNNVVQYGTHTAKHVGFNNITAYLQRLVPTFSAADRVLLAGSSAGGVGAVINWWQTQQAFGSIRVDLIDDSGPLLSADVVSEGGDFEAMERVEWNLASTLPPGCTTCAQDLSTIYGFYAQAFPNNHGAFLSYTQDSVIPFFYGITTAQFTAGLNEMLANQFAPSANLRYFLDVATGHVLWFTPALASTGVPVRQWITQMVTDDTAWASVQP
jgi:Pectinacetylesterase